MIELVDVNKTFISGKMEVKAVQNVSIKIEKEQIYGIIGYSGAGKSTLIRCINLLERPTSGEVLFKGEDLVKLEERGLRKRRKKIGMIFQHFNLFNSRTVYENVAYPLRGVKLSKEEKRKKVLELLELVELKDKIDSYPSQLSGGQKQRVSIARALANDPEVLLCDEATSALDPKTTKSILGLLKKLNEELGLTIILITHQMEVIKEICHRVSIMENGRIIEEGDIVKIFSNPEHETTKEFIAMASNKGKIQEILEMDENIFNIKEDDILTRVQYVGESAKDAILSQASIKYGIHASVLHGNIEILNKTPVGELIVLFSGELEAVAKSIDYFRNNGLSVEIINKTSEAI